MADGYALKMQLYESSVGLANSLSPERQRGHFIAMSQGKNEFSDFMV